MGYNQANNPFSRKASPLKQVEQQVYEHEPSQDEIYEDPRSGFENSMKTSIEQIIEMPDMLAAIGTTPRSGENYLAQESYENPGYDEYGGKIRGKLGRKERKLQKVKQQLLAASEPSPQKKMSKKKWDRKIDKGLKTQRQIKALKENQ